ncbi:MAG: PEP-CTERM sorting domain-containing protein [Phycisphaerae bacterium]|nr:PEP-CTERM sorting domain-containing protein [Phycisphaerae bacterium]
MIDAIGSHNGGRIGPEDLQKAMMYPSDGTGWRVTVGEGSLITATYTFAAPVTIDAVSLSFYRPAHMPSADANCVTFSFDSGAPVTVAPIACPDAVPGEIREGAVRYAISERTITTMTVTFDYTEFPTGISNGFFELDGIGVYLAQGQQLAIDGTYNIFHEENGLLTMTDDSYANAWRWADCNGANYANPPGGGGFAEWHFSQAYTFYGGSLTHAFNSGRALFGAQVWVSDDEGATWTPLIALGVDDEGDEIPFDWGFNNQYKSFAEAATGSWVRLTWEDSIIGLSEITSFQLFGKAIPEPMTMSLLALGGLTLLRRRRA